MLVHPKAFLMIEKILLSLNTIKNTILRRIYSHLKRKRVSLNGVTYQFDLRLDKNIINMVMGSYGRDIVRLMKKYLSDSDAFIDVGANIGYLTFVAAGLVGKRGQVHAFEPMRIYFDYLRKFGLDNPDRNIIANNVGLGDTSTVKKMDYAIDNIGVNTFIEGVIDDSNPAKRTVENIPIITFDDYTKNHSIGHVGLIKIDTEGYEYFVLQGMREFLMNNKPPIIVEVNSYAMEKFRGGGGV